MIQFYDINTVRFVSQLPTSENKIHDNVLRMMEFAVRKQETYRRLDRVLGGINNDELKELYQENKESHAQIPADVEKQLRELFGDLKSEAQITSTEDIRKNIKLHLRKMIEMTEGEEGKYNILSAVLQNISEDDLRKSYQEYKADMLLNSKADKGRNIDVIGIFATVAVSVAILGF